MKVVVVGAGVIGLFSALELSERGHQVEVLDALPEGGDNCSSQNAGMVVPSHFIPLAAPGMAATGLRMMWNPESPFAFARSASVLGWGLKFLCAASAAHVERAAPLLLQMNMASREKYVSLSERTGGSFGLKENGLLLLCRNAERMEEERHVAAKAREMGLRAKTLERSDLSAIEPGLDIDALGGVLFEDDCHLSPEALILALRETLRSRGVVFHAGTRVLSWNLEGNKVLAARGERSEHAADLFVLATGAETPSVARGLGLRLPMVGGKGYSFTVPNPRQCPEACAILAEARVAVTPVKGGLRFAGTMELGAADLRVNQRRVEGIRKAICRYYPAFRPEDFHNLPIWAGRRPCTPDGLPYIGIPRRTSNLVVAAGHAMMGTSLAPITGELVADLVENRTPRVPLDLLNPDRYA